jgi:hypothetical protein
MGSSGPSASDRQSQGYSTGYSQYQPGVNPVSIYGTQQSKLNMGAYKGWEDAAADYEARQNQGNDMWGMFAEMMGGMHGPDYGSYAEQAAAQEAAYNAKVEEQRIQAGRQKVSELYSGYMNAASTATDYINSQISNEMSNAALLGIDYKLDDTIKSERISNYFASIWGEGDQASLETGINEFGAPSGFEGFTIVRGNADVAAEAEKAETVKAQSKGIRPNVLEDEDNPKPGTVLGI